MRRVVLHQQGSLPEWRKAARGLLAERVPPAEIIWQEVGSESDLFSAEAADANFNNDTSMRVPKRFLDLARLVVCHSDPARFDLLYRLLWRLRDEPELLSIAPDPEVRRATSFMKSVRRDVHKMRAFVRFRETEEGVFVAWFEPSHHIIELNARFFQRRFANMAWTILTPRRSVNWDGEELRFAPGATRADAPDEDALEAYWRTYYAHIFNPARLKIRAMQAEMPKKYWKNLPEADLIPGLIRSAGARTSRMVGARGPISGAPRRDAGHM